MLQDFSLFMTMAQIAGIFVGFGALISITSKSDIDVDQLGQIRAVVTIGLTVIVAALLPVGLGHYGLTGHTLWLLCSLVFLMLSWGVTFYSLQRRENRELTLARVRANPISAVFFWLLLEIPMQLPLILTVLGLYPNLEVAFYITALVLNLFQAAFVLAQFVYSQQQHTSLSTKHERSSDYAITT